MRPRSTRLTGISGSWISASAASSRSFISGGSRVRLAELVELLLEQRDHLVVSGAPGAPPLEDVVPTARIVEVPALGLLVKGARERIVDGENLAGLDVCES